MYFQDKGLRIEGTRYAGIVVKDKKILMIHRIRDGYEYWVFPGGHRRKGEGSKMVVVREIEEETSVIVKSPKLVFEFHDYNKKVSEYYFVCQWKSGKEPSLKGEEKARNSKENYYEPVWIDFNKFGKINVLPVYTKEWVKENIIK